MILRNKKGRERSFKLLLKLEDKGKKYLVYEDIMSKKIYAGMQNNAKLERLEKEEVEKINKVLERISG